MFLTIENAQKSFGSEPVLQKLSLEMHEGEIVALLGPSGCGKTTLLRSIAGLEVLDKGRIVLQDTVFQDEQTFIKPEKRGIGFVFQDYALFPHLNVVQNIQFGLFRLPKSEQKTRTDEMLQRVGLSRFAHRKPHELSGGQQQRVALARAMAQLPKLLLLDEPFSGLDALLREETREEVRQVLKSAQMSAILVTHDQEEALCFADRIGVMQHGKLEQFGTPEHLYDHPKSLFVAQFLGKTNLFFGELSNQKVATPIGDIPVQSSGSGAVMVAVRPEYLQLYPKSDSAVQVIGKEFKGHDISYRLSTGTATFFAHSNSIERFEVGNRVGIRFLKEGYLLQKETE